MCLAPCLAHFNYCINCGHNYHQSQGQSDVCSPHNLNCSNFCMLSASFLHFCHPCHHPCCCHCCCQCPHYSPFFLSNRDLPTLGFYLKNPTSCICPSKQNSLLLSSWADWWQSAGSSYLFRSPWLYLSTSRFSKKWRFFHHIQAFTVHIPFLTQSELLGQQDDYILVPQRLHS